MTTDEIVKAMITQFWGKRCEEYEPECACCYAWKHYDETGRFIGFDELIEEMP
jgi:hypothetical protein